MRRSFLILATCFLLAAAAAADPQAPQRQMESSFASGSSLEMHLGPGDYHVRAGDGDKIVVTCSTRNLEDLRKVKMGIRAGSHGSELWISGPHSNFQVTIEVPSRTDLRVRLTAGDLDIKEIEGNKDIENHAGDVSIDVVRPEDYSLVDVSVRVGDLSATPFGSPKGWLGGSLHKVGSGPYTLHAHLLAGDLRLYARQTN